MICEDSVHKVTASPSARMRGATRSTNPKVVFKIGGKWRFSSSFHKKRNLFSFILEAYQVGRPAMGLVTSFLYLYASTASDQTPSLKMTLYFAFIFQLGCNAGNDYMDWERDRAEENRELSLSRGKAHCKDAAWWMYLIATAIACFVGLKEPLFGAQYFVVTEVAGQLAYNGIFLGMPIHKLSLVKCVGFPLDVVVAAWTYMPFAALVAQRSWVPNLTVAAWGTTMLWAQLKDYHHEKDTQVRTTATHLGPTKTAFFISLAALIMVLKDPRFLPYGIYTLYRCYIYPNRGVGNLKMTIVMALNLVGIVFSDGTVPSHVKYPAFFLQVLAFFIYKSSSMLDTLQQKYYGFDGIIHRHRPYDDTVWHETDPNVLLWKVGRLTGRSASGAMGLFSTGYARLCLMGFIIFRTQDTWADVCLDSEDRIEGLKRLPTRLSKLLNRHSPAHSSSQPESPPKTYSPADISIGWDFGRPRNRMYVDIALNMHRFDPVFIQLPKNHQQILLQYASELAEGWIELERRKDEPISPEIMRKHAEVALDSGFFGMCKGASPNLIAAIDPKSRSNLLDPEASAAYIAFSDGLWAMNLAATIEDDVKEGVTLDDELRAMNGNLDDTVVRCVRIKWLTQTLTYMGRSTAFLCNQYLIESWSLRFFILFFLHVTVNECEKWLREYQEEHKTKTSGIKLILRALLQSRSREGYYKGIFSSLFRAESLRKEFGEVQGNL